AVAITVDGAKLAYAGAGNVVKVVDLQTGKPAADLKGHADAIASIRFSIDGALVLTGSADKTVRVWKAADGALADKVEAPAAVASVDWVADGKQVAAAGADGVIRVWATPDAATLAEGAAKPAPVKEIKAAAVELRGTAAGLLAAAADGKVDLWSLETGKSLKQIVHGAPVTAIAISADGKRWITLGGPTAGLWNAEDGKKIADLRTDGAAARRDRAAAALLAFAAGEVTFRQNAVKAFED